MNKNRTSINKTSKFSTLYKTIPIILGIALVLFIQTRSFGPIKTDIIAFILPLVLFSSIIGYTLSRLRTKYSEQTNKTEAHSQATNQSTSDKQADKLQHTSQHPLAEGINDNEIGDTNKQRVQTVNLVDLISNPDLMRSVESTLNIELVADPDLIRSLEVRERNIIPIRESIPTEPWNTIEPGFNIISFSKNERLTFAIMYVKPNYVNELTNQIYTMINDARNYLFIINSIARCLVISIRQITILTFISILIVLLNYSHLLMAIKEIMG